MQKDDLTKRFTYHAPTPEKVTQHEQVREFAYQFALFLNDNVPEGREKSLAITHLEDVVFWANAGIARN